ncbi:lipid III flippase WzxE [Enterobacterales bacterium CwR94]|nr:lipid III flippase WzxE [Enterobacterales bacterium CwR94]
MSLAKASIWTASSTLVKIIAGLVVIKLLAVSFGPEGVGQAGNYRQLLTVLGVLAGAGIFNGITKFVSEHQQDPQRLQQVTGTAATIVLISSLAVALVFLLAAAPISHALFGHERYQNVIRGVAFLQMGIAWANLTLAVLKGYRDARGNALSVIGGSLIGVAAYTLCYFAGGYAGALIGLALVPALTLLPAVWLLARREGFTLKWFKPRWQPEFARSLSKYTLMALMTAVTLPVAWMMMRNLLAVQYSWQQVGLWQAVTTISDAYLQFITATFSVWLLPTLARLQHTADIRREMFKAFRFVMPAVIAVSFSVWLLRDVAIWLLFSDAFHGMRDLFVWQLTGDVLKVGCYVFGYLIIAKAALRLYLLTEISQFVLLTGFSRWLIPAQGAEGAAQAYMMTYMVWFILCCLGFIIYLRRATHA